MTADRLKETVTLLKRQVAEQEARLSTYKETLEEIYDLYDTRVEELSLIRRLSDTLRTNLDLKKVCLTIVGLVMEELSPDGCLLCLLEPDGRLRLKASGVLGQRPAFWPEGHDIQNQAPAEGPLIQVVRDRKPILLPEMEPSQGWLHGAASFLGLPLISRQEPVGVFALLGSGPEAFHQETIRLMTIIGDQAAAALYNVRLFNELRKVNRDLRRSERAARLSRSSLERLLENANDLIVTLSRDGLIAYVNRKVRDLGFAPADLVGRPLSRLFDLKDLDPGRPPGGESGPVAELGLRDSAGQARTAYVSFTPLPPGERNDPVMLVIARDITERKQLERQLLHSEKLASVGLLAAGVAHEIGNPLSAILGYAQILKKKSVAEEAGQEYLSAVEEEARRIQRIIQELLAYSRPSAGLRDRIDLNEALVSILGLLTNQKLFRGLEVRTDLAEGEIGLITDRDRLAQLLVNLMVNAAQAMDGKGVITLTTRGEGEAAVIRVADTGPGVPPEIALRIFDPFFTTKPVGQGTGLGLSICHRIVEEEGGTIKLLPTPKGRGAVFEVRLPLAKE